MRLARAPGSENAPLAQAQDSGLESRGRLPSSGIPCRFAARTHPGRVRSRNEDQYAVIRHGRRAEVVATSLSNTTTQPVREEAYLFLVGDGLGGAAFGDVASAAALQMVWEMGVEEAFWPTQHGGHALAVLRERALRYVQRIHEGLTARAREDPAYRGMGTTLTAAYALGHVCFVTHVGDSRAYRIRGTRALQITKDHTMRARLEAQGIDASQAKAYGHVLTNCLGGDLEPARPDFHAFRLEPGDVLLLCTDGLTDVVDDAALGRVVREAQDPEGACDALVDLALARGGPDNVTVVAARFG